MSGNQIVPYFFKDMEVRSIKGDNGEPLFNAKDVCECLGLKDVNKAVSKLDEDDKGTNTFRTLGGNQNMIVVNESGLYHLIFASYKEEARAFKRWVTKEVLPSIRKTGGYVDISRLEEFMNSAILKAVNGLNITANKRRPGRLTKREKELVVVLYKEMYSIAAISREIGCDKGTVNRFLEQIRKERGVA